MNSSDPHHQVIPAEAGGEPPYHSFPDHGSEELKQFHVVAFAMCVLLACLAAVLHFFSEPVLKTFLSRPSRRLLGPVYKSLFVLIVVYLFPGVLMADMDTVPVTVLLVIVVDGWLIYKFQHRIPMRIGVRLFFLAFCAFAGEFAVLKQDDEIDYIGPMRVTHRGVAYYRPEQMISNSNPEYHYKYVPSMRLEWGHSWGCPAQYEEDTWCSPTRFLSDDPCASRRITCQGKPPSIDNAKGCLSEMEEVNIILKVSSCLMGATNVTSLDINAPLSELLGASEILDELLDTKAEAFDKDTPPWEDTNEELQWVEMAGNCEKCAFFHRTTETDVANEGNLWYCGIVLVAAGLAAFGYGWRKKEPGYEKTMTDEFGGSIVELPPRM